MENEMFDIDKIAVALKSSMIEPSYVAKNVQTLIRRYLLCNNFFEIPFCNVNCDGIENAW